MLAIILHMLATLTCVHVPGVSVMESNVALKTHVQTLTTNVKTKVSVLSSINLNFGGDCIDKNAFLSRRLF